MIDKRFSGWQSRALSIANSAVASAKENLELARFLRSKANDDVQTCESNLFAAKALLNLCNAEIEKDGEK